MEQIFYWIGVIAFSWALTYKRQGDRDGEDGRKKSKNVYDGDHNMAKSSHGLPRKISGRAIWLLPGKVRQSDAGVDLEWFRVGCLMSFKQAPEANLMKIHLNMDESSCKKKIEAQIRSNKLEPN